MIISTDALYWASCPYQTIIKNLRRCFQNVNNLCNRTQVQSNPHENCSNFPSSIKDSQMFNASLILEHLKSCIFFSLWFMSHIPQFSTVIPSLAFRNNTWWSMQDHMGCQDHTQVGFAQGKCLTCCTISSSPKVLLSVTNLNKIDSNIITTINQMLSVLY